MHHLRTKVFILYPVLLITFFLTKSFVGGNEAASPIQLTTIYGELTIDEPIIIELIQSKCLQRLKGIHQYGVCKYSHPIENYSRFDHSIGVYYIIKRFGAPINQQIAGLLEDTSHTVFSHVGDYVFSHFSEKTTYQDNIRGWYLAQTEVPKILSKYGLDLKTILSSQYLAMIDQDIPNLCADRIEYNLQGGYLQNLINKEEVQEILNDLRYEDKKWYFIQPSIARKFAHISLHMTEKVWGKACGILAYQWAADAILRAIELNIISQYDVHFSTDDVIWEKLKQSKDIRIQQLIERVENTHQFFEKANARDYMVKLKAKFRGIDPWVKTPQGFRRLTSIDPEFKRKFNEIKEKVLRGWFVNLLPQTLPTDQAKEESKTKNSPIALQCNY